VTSVLRVAVVGAGPAGVYAAEALLRYAAEVSVDVLDGLPAPYGLVRYGVAPDHPRTQSIADALGAVLSRPGIRFLGNVAVGTDLGTDDLRDHYDAVVVATGAATDRHLGVPGEDLAGCVAATDLVAWYTGHPDAAAEAFTLDAETVVVVGAGNVAGDVSRMLARTPEELRATDVPDHVLAAFEKSAVRDVHLVARRGPAQAKFTTRELRELGELADADVLLDPADLELDHYSTEQLPTLPSARRNLEVLQQWTERPPPERARRVHLHFRTQPVDLLGTGGSVSGVRLQRTRVDPDGVAVGAGDTTDVAAGLVVRAVGYRSLPLPGLPFDDRAGVVPHVEGRVVADGGALPGTYVAGWAKRGPTGVIGTNKHDARETVRSLLADRAGLLPAPHREPADIDRLLSDRGVEVVDWAGWCRIDAAERARGAEQGRDRVKIADRAELLRIAAADS
jgi:ferredoxin/flavodoxin---NADP+ reductase